MDSDVEWSLYCMITAEKSEWMMYDYNAIFIMLAFLELEHGLGVITSAKNRII